MRNTGNQPKEGMVYSQAVADLFPDSGGWVSKDTSISVEDAAARLLAGLSELVGSETTARALLAEIPQAKEIVAALPKRCMGRPKTADKRARDEALWMVCQHFMQQGMPLRDAAKKLKQEHPDIGNSWQAVERRLHELKRARRKIGN